METRIGDICNAYGALSVKKENDKYYWAIEDYWGSDWKEIPKMLYESLMFYQQEKDRIG